MKLVTLKDPKLVELTGIQVEFTTIDNGIHSVRITDPKSGRSFVIDKGESYTRSINVYEVQTHETKDVWEVSFSFGSAKATAFQRFDSEIDANDFIRDMKSVDRFIKAEKITMKVPLGEGDPVPTARADYDEVPF